MNDKYMMEAFSEADKAFEMNEVPIGAVIVKNGEILAKAHNRKEIDKSVCSHAEILTIIEASQKIDNWRLDDCDIYVSLDPCPMCASAIKQARIKNVYSALENTDNALQEIIKRIFESDNTNPKVNFYTNLAHEKSQMLLSEFFKNKRN